MAEDMPQDESPRASRLSRRNLIKSGAVAGLLLSGVPQVAAGAQDDAMEKPGSTNIVRGRTPPLEETRVEELDGVITPTRNFYIRNHFATPAIDVSTWQLRVD